jgi:hypothetical protein
MRNLLTYIVLLGMPALLGSTGSAQPYRWLSDSTVHKSIAERFAPPSGFTRVTVAPGSFAAWLRYLPLKPDSATVLLYDGSPKANQSASASVIAIDVGSRDLQQCADAVIRLRSEYLFMRGSADSIAFTFTSGDTARWRDWLNGYRPQVQGNDVGWEKSAAVDSSYRNFHRYLQSVFTYAGSISLLRDSDPKWAICDIEAGDFFAEGGSPGHAVLVVDVAEDTTTGRKMFLLAQSYMPAQDVHILINPNDSTVSPWYPCECEDRLITPEWTFPCDALRQF